ncbi:adenylate/guanylate cyclase domain-containing protein [Glaciibacter sp. 2TAF33]|uniref:adenylate/guanylate cyclase domain-containing protein n=1 Tax=Glaciibacter sp. 2TAF33 TaxID=3233015 RepID=UPI003F90A9A5
MTHATPAGSPVDGTGPRAAGIPARRFGWTVLLLLAPLAGFVLLIVQPNFDGTWEHHPSHFWLVLAIGGINAVLAWATGSAARLRGDARLVLVSLSFLSAAGFLALHALATPQVLLPTPNPGFVLATPAGLLVAAVFAAASSLPLSEKQARAVVRRAAWLLGGLVALMALWAVASLLLLGPFATAPVAERASGPLAIPALAGLLLYAFAVYRYLTMPRHPASALPLAMAAAFTLLAEAEIAIIWGRNWHASWWEWHLLMLAAFVLIAVSAQRSWREERWAGLYRPETAAGERAISVVFADLQNFTGFSEKHPPEQVTGMLNTYFNEAIPPVVQRFGGVIDRIVGDAVMVTFNTRGDQPDHARRAAGAALALQTATAAVAAAHPDWPRFRAGINTGVASVGILGTGGGRTYTAIGDVVNVASRLEGLAPVGGVAVSADTLAELGGARAEPLGRLQVKGRDEPVEAYQLVGLG